MYQRAAIEQRERDARQAEIIKLRAEQQEARRMAEEKAKEEQAKRQVEYAKQQEAQREAARIAGKSYRK